MFAALFVAGIFVGADSMSRAAGVPTYLADIMLDAHADTLSAMFPEGGGGPMTVNEPQLAFVWGVLLGNWLAAEFLWLKAQGAPLVPSQELLCEAAEILLLPPGPAPAPELRMPGPRQAFMQRRAFRD